MNKIKALEDRTLDVLAVPFGSPRNKDLQGEYFDASTNLHLDKFATPLILYHHGEGQDQAEVIGDALGHEIKEDGLWVKVKLNASKFAEKVWAAAQRGFAAASSGTVGHLMRRAADGRILDWPLVELSLFDVDKSQNRQPANPAAIAIPAKSVHTLPAAQAIYKSAGVAFPEVAPVEDKHYTEAEGKALQEYAKKKLVEWAAEEALEKVFRARAFDRPPTALEMEYEAAARGVVKHFGNTRLESFPVRFLEQMPNENWAGLYEVELGGPQILLMHRGNAEQEYKTFLHECGHALDNIERGEARFRGSVPAEARVLREAKADEYRGILSGYAWNTANRLYYGNKKSVKSISIEYLLKALAA